MPTRNVVLTDQQAELIEKLVDFCSAANSRTRPSWKRSGVRSMKQKPQSLRENSMTTVRLCWI